MERNDPYADEEADAAGAEAAQIGGTAGDEDLPDADRPVIEAGGGEAEGFELAEEDLIEHATHGDEHSGRMALYDAPDAEEAGSTADYGEADHEHSDEGDEDDR